jgi:hypothetical protein
MRLDAGWFLLVEWGLPVETSAGFEASSSWAAYGPFASLASSLAHLRRHLGRRTCEVPDAGEAAAAEAPSADSRRIAGYATRWPMAQARAQETAA